MKTCVALCFIVYFKAYNVIFLEYYVIYIFESAKTR